MLGGLQRAAQADDRCFHEVLYNTLIDLRAAHELLSTDTPYLEQHLRTNGGLPPVPVSGPVGPLTQSQARCPNALCLAVRTVHQKRSCSFLARQAAGSRAAGVSSRDAEAGVRVQVYNLELLARLYRKREEYGNAASVYEILASRKSGVADQAISLARREEAYQEAVLQVQPFPSCGIRALSLVPSDDRWIDTHIAGLIYFRLFLGANPAVRVQARAHGEVQNVDRLEVKQAIVQLQQRVVEALEAQATALPVRGEQSLELRKYGKEDPSEQTEAPGLQEGSADRVELHDVVVDLQEAPKELTQLYNDCAVPHRLWALGLEMTALANFDNPAYIRQLWDLYLQQVPPALRAPAEFLSDCVGGVEPSTNGGTGFARPCLEACLVLGAPAQAGNGCCRCGKRSELTWVARLWRRKPRQLRSVLYEHRAPGPAAPERQLGVRSGPHLHAAGAGGRRDVAGEGPCKARRGQSRIGHAESEWNTSLRGT